MRTLLLIIAATTLLIPMTAWAEFSDNPDRFASFGISLGLAGESGTAKLTDTGFSAEQDATFGSSDITLDFRAPVSNSVTLFGALSFLGDQQKYDETAQLAGQKLNASGAAIRIGARIYFNGR